MLSQLLAKNRTNTTFSHKFKMEFFSHLFEHQIEPLVSFDDHHHHILFVGFFFSYTIYSTYIFLLYMNLNSQAWHFACIRDKKKIAKKELNGERDCQWKKIVFEIDNIAHNRRTIQKLNKYVGHMVKKSQKSWMEKSFSLSNSKSIELYQQKPDGI